MSQEETWVRVTACENIPVREGRMIVVRGRQIAVFNLGDHFLAVDNRCPHQGGPLSEGIVSGTTVVCPLHAWKIDLKSGTLANSAGSAACIATFRTRVSDGIVELQVASGTADHEPDGENVIHRDRPIRWVQRKPSSPISAPSEVL
jgi:nitrite reductase (NADH) small subunit